MSASERQEDGAHYLEMPIQPWDAMAAWMAPLAFRGYLRGNVIKYLARAGSKGPAVNDYRKAMHYLARLIEAEELKASLTECTFGNDAD